MHYLAVAATTLESRMNSSLVSAIFLVPQSHPYSGYLLSSR